MENRLVVFRGQRWGEMRWGDECGYKNVTQGTLGVMEIILYLVCVNVNILVATLYGSFANFYHWGKLGKWYMGFLYFISYNLL